MIVGVDHLALSCDDLDAACAALERAGYHAAFVERELRNSEVKAPFVHELHPAHSIAYFDTGTGTPLELTNYGGPVVDRPASYQALVATPPGEALGDGPWTAVWQAVGCRRPRAYAWPGLGVAVWADDGGVAERPPAVRAVLCAVADPERATEFWRVGVGCRKVDGGQAADGRAWRRLAFVPPFRSWTLDLVLAEGEPSPHARLDDRGFPCLGLLCTSLARDGRRLLETGATETSGRFDITVNGRRLAVAFFRGPHGELLELIEVRRDTT